MNALNKFNVGWHGAGRVARNAAHPEYPAGFDADVSRGALRTCTTPLPYPAKECGYHIIVCSLCGVRVVVTAAGRADDPRSVKIACKIEGAAQ